jgi:hypothetical protein
MNNNNSAFIKGWDGQPIIISGYHLTVTIMTVDLLIYSMNPFEGGELLVSRFWNLFVMLTDSCSAVIGNVSLNGNLK